MELGYIIALLGTGVGVGLASGLLGIGGCFIMVPVTVWVFGAMGMPLDLAIKIAFGTNLLVVFPTAMSSSWAHSRKKSVWWKASIILGISGAAGALLGSTITSQFLSGQVLKIAFGGVVLAGAIRMLIARPPTVNEEPSDNPWLWVAWGLPLGIVSGMIGLGGGIIMVPVMVMALRFKMHHAVGTSTAMMMFTSLAGAIGYMVNGLSVSGIPSPHIGYIHIWSWLCLAGTSVAMAQIGAMTAHKLPAKQLKWIFIAVMFYMGLKMIGVFDWLNLPI
jgi:uncharacterized membrane protein YfcA